MFTSEGNELGTSLSVVDRKVSGVNVVWNMLTCLLVLVGTLLCKPEEDGMWMMHGSPVKSRKRGKQEVKDQGRNDACW